jgi:hypothetical protein
MRQERYIGFGLILLSLALSVIGITTDRSALPFTAIFFFVGLVLLWRGRH